MCWAATLSALGCGLTLGWSLAWLASIRTMARLRQRKAEARRDRWLEKYRPISDLNSDGKRRVKERGLFPMN